MDKKNHHLYLNTMILIKLRNILIKKKINFNKVMQIINKFQNQKFMLPNLNKMIKAIYLTMQMKKKINLPLNKKNQSNNNLKL